MNDFRISSHFSKENLRLILELLGLNYLIYCLGISKIEFNLDLLLNAISGIKKLVEHSEVKITLTYYVFLCSVNKAYHRPLSAYKHSTELSNNLNFFVLIPLSPKWTNFSETF